MDIIFIVKTILEGLAVAIAAFFIPKSQMKIENIIAIALSASAVFLLLDQFSPEIGASVRQGSGFGIGLNQVGWGQVDEGFEDCKFQCLNNPAMCSSSGPCHQLGGRDCQLQKTIDIGTDVSNNPVRYGSHCSGYYVVKDDKVKSQCLSPHDTVNLSEPYGMRSIPPQWSQTDVSSRKMNFNQSNCPVNDNINEFKLVPGTYSKYALQSGYNENVESHNNIVRLEHANWLTNNPLDLHHFQPIMEDKSQMNMY